MLAGKSIPGNLTQATPAGSVGVLLIETNTWTMEYVQERITTIHDFGGLSPSAPVEAAAVVVPMTERELESAASERVLSTLAEVGPARVIVPLRAPPDRVPRFVGWIEGFDLDVELLWCTSPAVESLLADHGLTTDRGKGRDVWLGLGVAAADHEYVVVHDADTASYSREHVPRLLAPLAHGYRFSKGYYARIEDDRIYGRLFRLFVVPLLRTLRARHSEPILAYLDAFRYALAGEFAMDADLARSVRAQPSWGLELGTLGEAFANCGFEGSSQVDLGRHEHDHRSVTGGAGLAEMASHVASALFRVLTDNGVDVSYSSLELAYRQTARTVIDQYATDASLNGLEYDPATERHQVSLYADAIGEPGPDHRLPAWQDASMSPADVRAAATDALETAAEISGPLDD